MGKADLHIHTTSGDGMADIPEILDYVQEHTDLDVIAVTEHDDLQPSLETREAWARRPYRFEVATGMEVTTLEGHLIALYVDEPVASLRPLAETLAAVHRAGGLCVVAHPMSWLTRSIGQRVIERALARAEDGVYFDGIEVANASPSGRVTQEKARRLNAEHYHLAPIGSSDAHFAAAIGSSHTLFDGSSAADLRRAIIERKTRAIAGRYPPLRELGLGQVMRQQWRGITATPRKMGWGPTVASFVKRGLTIWR